MSVRFDVGRRAAGRRGWTRQAVRAQLYDTSVEMPAAAAAAVNPGGLRGQPVELEHRGLGNIFGQRSDRYPSAVAFPAVVGRVDSVLVATAAGIPLVLATEVENLPADLATPSTVTIAWGDGAQTSVVHPATATITDPAAARTLTAALADEEPTGSIVVELSADGAVRL